eukprot:3542490-Rhodomonas_salina.1
MRGTEITWGPAAAGRSARAVPRAGGRHARVRAGGDGVGRGEGRDGGGVQASGWHAHARGGGGAVRDALGRCATCLIGLRMMISLSRGVERGRQDGVFAVVCMCVRACVRACIVWCGSAI